MLPVKVETTEPLPPLLTSDPHQTLKNPDEHKLVAKGLPLDWLVRANLVANVETLVYLSQLREKWVQEDQKVILTIIQNYEQSKKGLIPKNDPIPEPPKKRNTPDKCTSGGDSPKTAKFTSRLLHLVKDEPVIWDKIHSPDFGYHQPMRQAWCSISLKLGGWGTMQHVHMLKQFYRRKRDQYNIDYLRLGRPFQYSVELSFLKDVLEMTSAGEIDSGVIRIEEHVKASAPEIVYEDEITEAPEEIKETMKEVSDMIDKVAELYPNEALAEFLTFCCNQVVRNREDLATAGLLDHEWVNPDSTRHPDCSQSSE